MLHATTCSLLAPGGRPGTVRLGRLRLCLGMREFRVRIWEMVRYCEAERGTVGVSGTSSWGSLGFSRMIARSI